MTTLAQAPVNQKPPPQPRQAPPRQRDIADMLDDMKGDLLALERAVAGYRSLSQSLATFSGTLAPGQREKGPLVFNHKGSVDDVHMIDVFTDSKDIDPAYTPYVLAGMANAHGRHMQTALGGLMRHAAELHEVVSRVLVPVQQLADNNDGAEASTPHKTG